MKENIRETVRKLLRVAKTSKGNESKVARTRAFEMMERHGITITDDNEEYREVVPGVAGVFFREQLMNGIAAALNCRLLRADKGRGRYEAVLSGYASDVARATEVYDRLHLDLVVQCRASFVDYSTETVYEDDEEGRVDGLFGQLIGRVRRVANGKPVQRSRFEDPEVVYEAWQRSFLSTASAEIAERLMNGPEKPRPRGPVVYAPPEKPVGQDEEIQRILKDTALLAGKYTKYGAQEIQRAAVAAGQRAARSAGPKVVKIERKLLTANSSFLAPPPPPPKPPEPSRFSELDY